MSRVDKGEDDEGSHDPAARAHGWLHLQTTRDISVLRSYMSLRDCPRQSRGCLSGLSKVLTDPAITARDVSSSGRYMDSRN